MSTLVLRNVKGSALTFTEMDSNFSNLNSDKLEAVVSDTTPQLGGNLDVNGNAIVSASNGNIAITPDGTGKIILDGLSWPTADGTANYYLKTDGAGNLSWAAVSSDTNTTYAISAETTTGGVNLRLTGSDTSTDDVKLAAGSNITLTRTDANTITIAATDTDTGITDVVQDTTPQLGGNLDVNGYNITSASNGNITIQPNGTGNLNLNGSVIINYGEWPSADGTNGQVLTTNGAGQLSWSTVSGGGGATELNDLTDVSYSGAGIQAGDILKWTTSVEGGYFANATNNLSGLSDVQDMMSPSNGQVLAYNESNTQWEPTSITQASGNELENVVEDTSPQLGGELDCQGNVISNPVLKDYAETIYSLGSTDSPTLTVSNGNVQSVTITSGLSLPAFSDAAAGQSITLLVSGTGTASGTGAYLFAGGSKTLTTSSVVSIFYDGTTYWTSIATGFAA